jgi:hypothetical protein
MFGSAAMAHTVRDQCAPGERGPGHPGCTQHHVKPLVGQGNEHNPGEHKGFSHCVR